MINHCMFAQYCAALIVINIICFRNNDALVICRKQPSVDASSGDYSHIYQFVLTAVPVSEGRESKCHWNQVPKDLVTNTWCVKIHLHTDTNASVWLSYYIF